MKGAARGPCRVLTDSPFDTLEKTFDLLVAGLHPLALDDTSFDGLADRAISLGELKAVLLPGLRRAVWPLVQVCPGKAAEIEAETLAAFLVAELIGATRIGDVELADVANALGISYKACHQRHPPDRYSSFEFVETRPETPCSSNGGRPRQDRSMDRRPDKRRSTPTPRT